jgi:hypothetical protein
MAATAAILDLVSVDYLTNACRFFGASLGVINLHHVPLLPNLIVHTPAFDTRFMTRLLRVCRPFMYCRCFALLARRKCAGPWDTFGQYILYVIMTLHQAASFGHIWSSLGSPVQNITLSPCQAMRFTWDPRTYKSCEIMFTKRANEMTLGISRAQSEVFIFFMALTRSTSHHYIHI